MATHSTTQQSINVPQLGNVLGLNLAITSTAEAAQFILKHTHQDKGYICVAAVHTCILAQQNNAAAAACRNALLTVPDGKPLAWALKKLGHKTAQQVRGIDLTTTLLTSAQSAGLRVGFYGSDTETLSLLKQALKIKYPALNIAYLQAAPFCAIENMTSATQLTDIARAQLDLLFVGLGSPKQELWMHHYSPQLNTTAIGIGAVFDFLAGTKATAPNWMVNSGLEWLFRLLSEPKRLGPRYIICNSKFIAGLSVQLWRHWFTRITPPKN